MRLLFPVFAPAVLLSCAALATSPPATTPEPAPTVTAPQSTQPAPDAEPLHHLVRDGQPTAAIVVSRDAPKMVALAGRLLQQYVRDMTGATLPIQRSPSARFDFHVFLGESPHTQALGITSDGTRDGGFKIVSGDDHLVMLGDDTPTRREPSMTDREWDRLTAPDKWLNPHAQDRDRDRGFNPDYGIYETDGRGTMNAVHEFLYDQGMRWYYPSADGTIVPKGRDLAFPVIHRVVNPDFAIRDLYLYYKRFGHLTTSRYPGGDLEGSRDEHLNWQLSLRINKISQYVAGPFPHGLDAVTGREDTQTQHPEYYAVWDGKLMNGQDGNGMKQNLCSPELLDATIRYAKTTFDTSGAGYVSIWPADGFTRVSEHSEECRSKATPERGTSGAISDYVWDFVNNVAWAIHDDPAYGPEHRILGGAYTAYQLPPKNLSDPRGMAPNISVMITKWRTWTAPDDRQQHFQELTQQWIDLLPSREVLTYDYYLHNRPEGATESTPIFYPRLIAEDLAFLKGRSLGEYVEIMTNWPEWRLTWDTFAAEALNTYVTARLYWNADQDIDALLDEYYTLFYGPESEKMKALHEYSERNFSSLRHEPEFLVTMRNMAEAALLKAGAETVYGRRIGRLLGLMNARHLGEETTIDACQTLDSASTTYRLSRNVSAPKTCFPVNASGITLDCQGHTITFSTDRAGGGHAVHVDARRSQRGHQFTLRNCNIQDGSHPAGEKPGAAIHIHHANQAVIEDTRINTTGAGIHAMAGTHNVLRGNTVNAYDTAFFLQYGSSRHPQPESSNLYENNAFSSRDAYGAYLYQGGNDILRNNTFTSVKSHGLRLFRPTGTKLEGNTIVSESTRALNLQQPTNAELLGNTIIDR